MLYNYIYPDTFQEIPRENYRNNSFTYADGSSSEQKTFSVFQYCNSTCSLEDTQNKLVNHYEAFGASDIEILRTFTWPYFPMWNITGKGLTINKVSSEREG